MPGERTREVTLDPGASTDTPGRNHGAGASLPGPDAGHPLHRARRHRAASSGNRQPSSKASHDGSKPPLTGGDDASAQALHDTWTRGVSDGRGQCKAAQARPTAPDPGNRSSSLSPGAAPSRVKLALLNAVRHASGTTSGAEPPTATPDFNLPKLVDRVLSELGELSGRIILVIDDLHELKSPEALAQVTRLLTNLPPHVHAVLATRRDLRLRLHQLRLAGELAEIRAADLRFTERETRELLDASGIALSEAGAALLHQRTEGWAAGLRLAAISLAGHPDPERFVAEFSGSNRTVAEYLIAEMLELPARRRPGSTAAHLPARSGQR